MFLQFLQLPRTVQRKAGVFFFHCTFPDMPGDKQEELLVLSRTTHCASAGLLCPSLCRASMPGPQHSAGSWDQPGLPTRMFCPWFENSIYLLWVTIVTCRSCTAPLLLLGWVILSNVARPANFTVKWTHQNCRNFLGAGLLCVGCPSRPSHLSATLSLKCWMHLQCWSRF